MDVLSVATTVFALCKAIATWIDEHAIKEAIILEISSVVLQIRDILEPFTSMNIQLNGSGELQLSQSIRSVGDALERTREHMIVWKYKKTHRIVSFMKPSAVIQQLRDDERQLNRQLLILLTSLAVVGYFRDLSLKKTVLEIQDSAEQSIAANADTYNDILVDKSASEFWKDFVGAKIDFVSEDLFLTRLNAWYGGGLHDKASRLILMCLDEYNIGGVTIDNFGRALGKESLKDFIDRYIRGSPRTGGYSGPISDLKIPLLVWIDDEPENHTANVAIARDMGISVIQLTSTAVAKAWVDDNADFLQNNDDGSRVRFITDNTRMEFTPENEAFMNYTAGRSFLQYLRGHLYKAPVLVATTPRSLQRARYVNLYESAGVTTDREELINYIKGLAQRRNDDTWWQGFQEEQDYH